MIAGAETAASGCGAAAGMKASRLSRALALEVSKAPVAAAIANTLARMRIRDTRALCPYSGLTHDTFPFNKARRASTLPIACRTIQQRKRPYSNYRANYGYRKSAPMGEDAFNSGNSWGPSSKPQIRQPRMIGRSRTLGPMIHAIGFGNREIINARKAHPHQAVDVELPVLVAVGAVPLLTEVVPFIREAHGDAVAANVHNSLISR